MLLGAGEVLLASAEVAAELLAVSELVAAAGALAVSELLAAAGLAGAAGVLVAGALAAVFGPLFLLELATVVLGCTRTIGISTMPPCSLLRAAIRRASSP